MTEKRHAICYGRRDEDGRVYHYYSAELYASEEEARADLGKLVLCMSKYSEDCPEPPPLKVSGPMPKIKLPKASRR